jgi:hypothetical protein
MKPTTSIEDLHITFDENFELFFNDEFCVVKQNGYPSIINNSDHIINIIVDHGVNFEKLDFYALINDVFYNAELIKSNDQNPMIRPRDNELIGYSRVDAKTEQKLRSLFVTEDEEYYEKYKTVLKIIDDDKKRINEISQTLLEIANNEANNNEARSKDEIIAILTNLLLKTLVSYNKNKILILQEILEK